MPPFANGANGSPASSGTRRFVVRPASALTPTDEAELANAGPAAQLDVPEALKGPPLRVLFIAAEGVPFVKTGGLADVIGALPKALRRLGHDVRVVLPRYASINPARWRLETLLEDVAVPMHDQIEHASVLAGQMADDIPVYFVDAPRYFQRENLYGYVDDGERFILFCRAALEMLRGLSWQPDVLHCHDWHAAIVPNWTRTIFRDDPLLRDTATVFTIHNLAFQGIFGYRILEVAGVAEAGFLYPAVAELANVVDLMGRGILFADTVSTVSPRYAKEILTPQFGERLDPVLRERRDHLYGILNGIDTEVFDPATDRYITSHFDAFALEQRPANKAALQEQLHLPVGERIPVVGMISRLADQKGFDLLDQVLIPLIDLGVQLVISGTGDQHYHQMFQRLAARYPRQVAINLTFNSEFSQRIYAGSDLFLMPSRFEPCGVSQMLAMRYGSIPVVHRTGGLADTVTEFDPAADSGNGFWFQPYEPFQLFAALVRALTVYRFKKPWHRLMARAMRADNSWAASAEQYVALYRRTQELHRIARARETAGSAG
ncbi:MAG TPA: glycogen synthase GlgA [Ktedonobacterales bacterium]|jgi:starch synthase